jgi:hypothetical protein
MKRSSILRGVDEDPTCPKQRKADDSHRRFDMFHFSTIYIRNDLVREERQRSMLDSVSTLFQDDFRQQELVYPSDANTHDPIQYYSLTEEQNERLRALVRRTAQ